MWNFQAFTSWHIQSVITWLPLCSLLLASLFVAYEIGKSLWRSSWETSTILKPKPKSVIASKIVENDFDVKRADLAALLFVCCLLCLPARAQTPSTVTANQLNFPLVLSGPVNQASIGLVGNPGNATYYYWGITNSLFTSSQPILLGFVANAKNTLSSTNYVSISPNYTASATSLDLLRTTTPAPPQGACNCAVATGQTGVIKDESNSLNSYTIAGSSDPSQFVISLANEPQSTGVSNLILRQNGALVIDLSDPSSFTPAGPDTAVQYRCSSTICGNAGLTYNQGTDTLQVGSGGISVGSPVLGANASDYLDTSVPPPASDSSTALATTSTTVSLESSSPTQVTVNPNTAGTFFTFTGHSYTFGAGTINSVGKKFHVHIQAQVALSSGCSSGINRYGLNIGGGTNDVWGQNPGPGTTSTVMLDETAYCSVVATGTSGQIRCIGNDLLLGADSNPFSGAPLGQSSPNNNTVTLDLTQAETIEEEFSQSASGCTNTVTSQDWSLWRDN